MTGVQTCALPISVPPSLPPCKQLYFWAAGNPSASAQSREHCPSLQHQIAMTVITTDRERKGVRNGGVGKCGANGWGGVINKTRNMLQFGINKRCQGNSLSTSGPTRDKRNLCVCVCVCVNVCVGVWVSTMCRPPTLSRADTRSMPGVLRCVYWFPTACSRMSRKIQRCK